MNNIKDRIAKRASQELPKHAIINLGIGIPTLIASYINEEDYVLHTENGMLGVTTVDSKNVDPLIVNAGKIPVGEAVGSSYFSSADSFAMIRGGHVDVAVLGALQIDEKGQIANWAIPGKDILGVGGAMDLLEGARIVIITTTHTSTKGEAKFVQKCNYPITSRRCADILVTELAVFKWLKDHYELVDLVGDTTLAEVAEKTLAYYTISDELKRREVQCAK